jgi:hypothetical protein
MFVAEKCSWDNGDVDFDISIQHSRYDYNYNTIWGRIRRACTVLMGKPVYFNSLIIHGDATFGELLNKMQNLLDDYVEPLGENNLVTDENMGKRRKFFTFPCDLERCCLFVFEKEREANTLTSETWMEYLISVQDFRDVSSNNSAWKRVKGALRAVFGRPVGFNNSFIDTEAKYKELVDSMMGLFRSDI